MPIAVKDNRPVAGMPITMCSDLFGDFVRPARRLLVRRLREAGFVIVGKTTLPENGILPTTESRRFGPTANPWALDRTPGGSSGGSAAAVAAGMVPIAHGNDGGGSIRIPAACCGLVGLKPARGRVSVGPDGGQGFLVTDGVLTRTVADTAAALDVLAGYEPGDATWAPPPPAPYAELRPREPGRLRIGLALNPPLDGAELDPVNEAAARDAAALLESLGHEVEEFEPPWSGLGLLPDFTRAFGPAIAHGHVHRRPARRPRAHRGRRRAADLGDLGARPRPRHDRPAHRPGRAGAGRPHASWPSLRRFDVVVDARAGPAAGARSARSTAAAPTLGPLPALGRLHPLHGDRQRDRPAGDLLPLYHGDDGLPTGVQLIGPPAREELLLALARSWSRRCRGRGRRRARLPEN